MNKRILIQNTINWIKNKHSVRNNYEVEDVLISENLRGTTNKSIIDNFNNSNWDFIPDICVVIKINQNFEIVLINCYSSSIGLTNIGEMLCFSKISNPIYSFMISTKGHSNEISPIVLDKKIYPKLLNYHQEKYINLFCFNNETLDINYDTFIPVDLRDNYE